ncbi:TonB-dependent siderophore receptor [Sphingomonas pseudosanguinis]|uniref:Iron complex outermembrane receptor protein n=1 Tax=Sphingomonas pseudosanguinis TaxID=413712 RepID=A0A7W6AB34_9SPHN|nr:TonB-dependent siderophore receptor [Sphingomonas pseudosanguinis]MBB3879099.1 iron complex outermembrane receptor protein [Sphingomonas pseudosanguinis]
MSKTMGRVMLLAGCVMAQPGWAADRPTAPLSPVDDKTAATDAQSDIVVKGLREASASITGTDASARRYPQSLRIIDRALIDRLGATRLDDTVELAGGVARQNDFGGLWDKYSIRGFAGNENSGPDVLINRFSSNLGFNAPIDTATVERFEFLKGAAAALSGLGEPGGSLNIVTKTPTATRQGETSLSYGSWNRVRATGDIGGPVTDTLEVRMIGVAEEGDSFRRYVHTDRLLLAPSVAFTPSDSLRLLYQAEFMRNRAPIDRGVAAIRGDARAMDRATYLGEPADGRMTQRMLWQQGSVFAALSDRVSLEGGVSSRDGFLTGYATQVDFGARGVQADGRTIGRSRRFHDFRWQDLTARIEMTAKLDWLGLSHELRFGADRVRHGMDFRMDQARGRPGAPILTIDAFNPVYGQPLPVPTPFQDRHHSFRSESLYAQDLIRFGDFTALIGARWNNFRESMLNRIRDLRLETVDRGITPRAALTWAATPNLSLFTSWGQSLRLNPSDGVASFDAEKSDSAEVGAKYTLFGGALTGQTALFTMTKRNVLNPNATDVFVKTQIGRQRSRGVETVADLALTGGLTATGTFTYTDATVRNDKNAALIGTMLSNVPRYLGALDLHQRIGAVTIGGGVNHVGARNGDPFASGYRLPAYTTLRADATWRVNPQFDVRVDLENIFDTYYIASSYADVWTMPGAPRNVRVTLRGRF